MLLTPLHLVSEAATTIEYGRLAAGCLRHEAIIEDIFTRLGFPERSEEVLQDQRNASLTKDFDH